MSNELTVTAAIKVSNGNLSYSSLPTQCQANQSVANGPSPGAVSVATGGTDIGLSQLTTPAWARVINLDLTNFVTIGIYKSAVFYPLIEILPGQLAVFRLSRSALGGGATVRAVADTAAVKILFDCFDA